MRRLLIILATAGAASGLPAANPVKPGVLPTAVDADAWKQLPRKTPPLPVWARTLVGPLPKTTAAMLELDRLHRDGSPLGAVLVAKLRWAAADAIGCEYARKYAEYDLKRAKVPQPDVEAFVAGKDKPTDDERRLLKLARKLTTAAYSVTDAEFAAVLTTHGPEKIMAVVHTVAYCNFHYRILLALGAEVEPNGPLPPPDVLFDTDPKGLTAAPPRVEWAKLKDAKQPSVPEKFAWTDYGGTLDVTASVEAQKERTSRIPFPEKWRLDRLTGDAKRMADGILWNTYSAGYQPELTNAWFVCLRAFQAEAKLDRVAGNSLFWVVTRSNECFY
jgi:alkylhydroperoxidase family enzyme